MEHRLWMRMGSGGSCSRRIAAWAVVLLLVVESSRVAEGEEVAPTASGYLVVNKSSGARMFFAYYEAEEKLAGGGGGPGCYGEAEAERPVVLWLQGGPGCSGMVGNFYELGPWRVGEDGELHRNPAPWNRLFGLLFVDNPVGTGFSVAPSISDIPTDQLSVCKHLYSALQSFFLRFPSLRLRPFFVTGESYAGKYVPSLAHFILSQQLHHRQLSQLDTSSPPPLRLDGIAIGNGLTHPIAQVVLNSPSAYYMGVIDEDQRSVADDLAEKIVCLIEAEDWIAAEDKRNELLATLYDVRRTAEYYTTVEGVDYLSAFLNKAEVQEGLLKAEFKKWEPCSSVVSKSMAQDVAKSTKALVEALLNQSIPILLYQGQFDLRDGVASSEAWIRLLQWDGIVDFFSAERKIWKENGVLAGNVRSFSFLTHVVVSNAGHLVPADQELASQRMIEGWISRQQNRQSLSDFSILLSTLQS